jgi:hypothetical protein
MSRYVTYVTVRVRVLDASCQCQDQLDPSSRINSTAGLEDLQRGCQIEWLFCAYINSIKIRKHFAKYGPPLRQNELWFANLVIGLSSLHIKLVWHPSIAFNMRLWKILSESIHKRLRSRHSEICQTKPLGKVTDEVGWKPRRQEFIELCLYLVVVPIVYETIQTELNNLRPQPVTEITWTRVRI